MRTLIFEVRPWRATSVWRRIECTEKQTLFDLHLGIQRAFELDGDHEFAFFLNNRAWDRVHEYGSSDAMHDADTVALRELHLPLNKRLLYLFDFGDELRHEVKVVAEAIAENGAEYPRIVGGEGEAPPQHGDGDEDYYDEEDVEDGEDLDEEDEASLSGHPEDREASDRELPALSEALLACVPLLERCVAPYVDPEDDAGRAPKPSEAQPPLTEQLRAARVVLEQSDFLGTLEVLEADDLSLGAWFRALPGRLSEAGLHAEALELNGEMRRVWPGPLAAFELPALLARAGDRDQALAKVDENLHEYPDDPDMLLRVGVALDLLGETARAGSAFRDALAWAGSNGSLRGRITDAHAAMLERVGRGGEVKTLRQAERNTQEKEKRERLRELGIEKPIVRETPKVGPNEPCPCGSGKKYKKCCGAPA